MPTIIRRFGAASALNFTSAALNFYTTIIVVRWFGGSAYSNYIFDLSIVSIFLVIQEIVPTNFSIFKLQDDKNWQKSLAGFAIFSSGILFLVALLGGALFPVFHAGSLWIYVYVLSLGFKRYLDLRLQSQGRLNEYIGIDITISFVRLLLIYISFRLKVAPASAIWSSLAIASTLGQMFWFSRNREELAFLIHAAQWKPVRNLFGNISAFKPYYFGIILKRLKDNLVPIVVGLAIAPGDGAANFLIAYRGAIFAVGQLRIIEATLNHRKSLDLASEFGMVHRIAIAGMAQIACLAATAILLLSTKLESTPWSTAIVLSFVMWPIILYILERARSYSLFMPINVNIAMLSYLIVMVLLTLSVRWIGELTPLYFSCIVVASEMCAYFVLSALNRRSRLT